MSDILGQIQRIQERIVRATERSGRKAGAVTLLAVTKTVPLERVQVALNAGLRDVGENRVQEALAKFQAAPVPNRPRYHLIGPLQSNKAKKAVGFFDVIQTLDSISIARDIDRHAEAARKLQECLVEVKISNEPSKSGLAPEKLPELLHQLKSLSALKIRGLMGIPPLNATGDAARPYFQQLRRLFEATPGFDMLSMGMSSDFEAAIEEGSTLVRIGTALFGSR